MASVERLAGNLLRMARDRAGMSQRQLATAAGVAQLTVARIESGAMQPSLPLLYRLLAATGWEPRIRLEPYDAHDHAGPAGRTLPETASCGRASA